MKALLVAVFAVLLSTQSVFAADAAKGKETYNAKGCAGCHGPDGKSIGPTWPNLAGQKEQYIVLALQAYKEQKRTSTNAAQMAPFAGMLSDEEMADVAAFLSGL